MSKTASTPAPAPEPACPGCRFYAPGRATVEFADEPDVRPGMPLYDKGVFKGLYGEGLCRRYPRPEPVDPADWCGEFRPRSPAARPGK